METAVYLERGENQRICGWLDLEVQPEVVHDGVENGRRSRQVQPGLRFHQLGRAQGLHGIERGILRALDPDCDAGLVARLHKTARRRASGRAHRTNQQNPPFVPTHSR